MNNLAGTVLLQRFRMDALERQDYLGDDYRSWDLKRNLPLRIKVLRAELPFDPSLLSFQPGNTTLQTLSHPHIVPFYGLYQDHHISFIVERYVDGLQLREELLQRRGMPSRTGDALIYLKALCQALAYAQGFGLVHCNVNPANIWRQRDGNILLGGFGFAHGSDSRITAAGLVGSPIYVAPEILLGREVSPATDIYNLGLVLFELLTGQHPFIGPAERLQTSVDTDKLRDAHLNQVPPDPRRLNPALPEGLSQVLMTALSKAPKDRYQSPQEMLEVACAMLGSSPEAIPDQFDNPSAGAQTQVAATRPPLPLQGIPATAVIPGQAAPVPQAAPAYPPTQVMPAIAKSSAAAGSGLPSGSAVPIRSQYDQGRQSTSRPVVAGIVLAILLCLLVSGAVVFFFGRGLLQASITPTDTIAALATATRPGLASPSPVQTIASPTGQGQVLPPTTPPTQPPAETPAPSQTPAPTDTKQPANTLPPAPTSLPSAFTVTIRNNLPFAVYAFRDNQLMGTDPIPPRKYIFYRGIPTGVHTFTVCETTAQTSCQPERQVNVDKDLTVAFP